jgi:hypothetical protein
VRAVNLIPPDQRRGAGGLAGRTGGVVYVVIGGLIALVVLGVVYASAVHNIATRKTTLAEDTAQTAAVSAEAAALQPYVQFDTFTQQRVSAVVAIAEGRFDWARAMQQIALALPSTVSLGSISGSAGGAPAPSGATGTSGVSGDAAPATFSLSGCATTQLVVAETLTRLRELKDVGTVSLSTYSKPLTLSLKSSNAVAHEPCIDVSWSMTVSYNAGFGIPSPTLPPGVNAVKG